MLCPFPKHFCSNKHQVLCDSTSWVMVVAYSIKIKLWLIASITKKKTFPDYVESVACNLADSIAGTELSGSWPPSCQEQEETN